jgi:hypothetical protein
VRHVGRPLKDAELKASGFPMHATPDELGKFFTTERPVSGRGPGCRCRGGGHRTCLVTCNPGTAGVTYGGQWRSTEVAGSGAARKRRRRMDRVEHDLSDEHWTALKAEWGVCAYCGATDQPLQRDCVLALSRGGATRSTTSPACGSCNAARATTKSRAGCGASGSMSAPSWCTTSRSRRRSRCGSPPCQTSKRRRGKQPASHRSIQDRPDSAPVGRARRPGRGT